MKHILVLLSIILALFPEVYAEDDKWVDGISFRYGQANNHIKIYDSSENRELVMETKNSFEHHEKNSTLLTPITITFPENSCPKTLGGGLPGNNP